MSGTPGGTKGTPISGGVGTGLQIAEPLPATWLSLARYAQIMGVPPAHFFGAQASQAFTISGQCDTAWPRHSWQNNGQASREEILLLIEQAEDELAEFMGFNLAPSFVLNEVHQYPQHWRRTAFSTASGLDVRGGYKRIVLKQGGKLIQSGGRSVSKIGTATTLGGSLTYTDEDGDGFSETATVTLSTTETNVCELRAFVTDTSAQPEWEIRPAKKKSISSGVLEMTFNSWLFIDPDIDAAYPTVDGYRAIDISTTTNFMDSVDIYRVYADNTLVSARFFWERAGTCTECGGAGCDACSLAYQDGCAIVGDVDGGVIIPIPAEYSATDSIWNHTDWVIGRDPDQVRVSYYAGDISQPYLLGTTCDPLKSLYAKAIAYMATARLTLPVCVCTNLADNFESMREDLSRFGGESSHLMSEQMLNNPFGTRRGEVMAWNLIGRIKREKLDEVAVI